MKSAAELFDSVRIKPDPEAERRARAVRGLDIWAAQYFISVCELLRRNDEVIRSHASVLAMYEDGKLDRNPKIEEGFWEALGDAYALRSEYEGQLTILCGQDFQAKYQLWRRVK
jgi:hypothetical protein